MSASTIGQDKPGERLWSWDVKWCSHFRKQPPSLSRGKTQPSYDPEILSLGLNPRKLKTYVHIKLAHGWPLSIIAPKYKYNPVSLSATDELINKIWSNQLYRALTYRRNEILIDAITFMMLENLESYTKQKKLIM